MSDTPENNNDEAAKSSTPEEEVIVPPVRRTLADESVSASEEAPSEEPVEDDASSKEEPPLAAAPLLTEAKPAKPKKPAKKAKSKLSPKWILAFKIVGGLAALGIVVAIALLITAMVYVNGLRKDLPEYEKLAEYEPPVTTRVHAGDGTLVAEFARERRLFVPIETMPDHVKQAFLSAEDKNYYQHKGLDYKGILRAQINNIDNVVFGKPGPLEGGSTITQQVAKNFLLTSEQKLDRKVKEMLIALRMEKAFTKDHILELYLNEIYLGNRSYGVTSAALNYFEKSLSELTIAEAAYLATLAKAPSNYHPVRYEERAVARRNWIIYRMFEDGAITEEEKIAAQAEPLGAVLAPPLGARSSDTKYFAEAVRRQIDKRYGVDALYDGGLSIRSTLEPRLQEAAHRAFRKWLVVYDQRHGWRGALAKIDLPADLAERIESEKEETPPYIWQARLIEIRKDLETKGERKYNQDLEPWEIGVILKEGKDAALVGLQNGSTGTIPLETTTWAREHISPDEMGDEISDLRNVIKKGDVVLVEKLELVDGADVEDTFYSLQQVPAVNGGMLVLDPHTGRVLAMVGGFSFGLSEFNRSTQASRQPGSTFKPFVYAAALDNGYTPSSIVLDAPFVAPSLGDNWWKPGNYVAGRFYGESTLRLGIEKSRNTMTARLAQDIGIGMIIDYAERFGVSDTLRRELAISLGAGETTLMRLTTAYAMFVNGGKKIEPVLIDRVQNRYGETIYRRDERPCDDCASVAWNEQGEPYIPDTRQQVIDPRTAYQMVSILEGVVRSGTGAGIGRVLDKPVAGKTGTTNDYKDAWFVGFSPDLAVGVYVGFDTPRTLGQGEGGGIVSAPIFGEFMQEALADQPGSPFRIPSGVRLVRVNSKTGKPARPGEGNVILEAFKAEDDIEGSSRFRINGSSVDEGSTDEGIDDDLGGIY